MMTDDDRYRQNLARKAVGFQGVLPREDIVYAIFVDLISLHKLEFPSRFTIYPQMRLDWNPDNDDDRRSEIPDIGIGNFTPLGSNPPFKLRFGVEVKRAADCMSSFPPPEQIKSNMSLRVAFDIAYHQAQDQAKAAYRNDYPLSENGVDWILLVGPYWTVVKFGPFSKAQLSVRSHKTSGSGDFFETMNLRDELRGPPRVIRELYRLSSPASFNKLEAILLSTDALAQGLIESMKA